jgi:hypothetical protein
MLDIAALPRPKLASINVICQQKANMNADMTAPALDACLPIFII